MRRAALISFSSVLLCAVMTTEIRAAKEVTAATVMSVWRVIETLEQQLPLTKMKIEKLFSKLIETLM